MSDPELANDLDAAVQARKELGATYESELIESFLEKVEQRIDTAVDKQVRRQMAEQQMVVARGGRPEGIRRQGPGFEGPGAAFGLAAVSLVLAIPLSAIAAANLGLPGLIVCWGGIVGINACYTLGGSMRRADNAKD